VWDKNKFFLIKANKGMREWVLANCKRVESKKKDSSNYGYIVDFDELPVGLFNSANGMLPEMDPTEYRKYCVSWLMNKNDENGVPYKMRSLR